MLLRLLCGRESFKLTLDSRKRLGDQTQQLQRTRKIACLSQRFGVCFHWVCGSRRDSLPE
jgi:hypothetical protein